MGGDRPQSSAVSSNPGGWKKKGPRASDRDAAGANTNPQQDGHLQPAARHVQGNSQQQGTSSMSGRLSATAAAFVPLDDFVPSYRPPSQQLYNQIEQQQRASQQTPAASAPSQTSAPTTVMTSASAPGPSSHGPPDFDSDAAFRYRPPHLQPYQQHYQPQQQQHIQQQQQYAQPPYQPYQQQQQQQVPPPNQQQAIFQSQPHQSPSQQYQPQQQQQPTSQRQPKQPRNQRNPNPRDDSNQQPPSALQPQQPQSQQPKRQARGKNAAPPAAFDQPTSDITSSSVAPPTASGRGRGGKQQRGESRADARVNAQQTRQKPVAPKPLLASSGPASTVSPGPSSSPSGHVDNSLLAKTLTEQLMSNSYCCSICSEEVRRRDPIWSCSQCHIILHLKCMRKWYESNRAASLGDTSHRCPGCQYVRTEPPGEYYCFCGKTFEPDPSDFLTPHACNLPCGKMRSCGVHACNLPCHPGHCARCTLPGGMTTCACGATERRLKCGDPDIEKSTCGATCGKKLACGKHSCERACHNGPCDPCAHKQTITCFCSARTEERACGQEGTVTNGDTGADSFSCAGICGHTLDCGNHKCARRCHAGPCDPCKRGPPTNQDDTQACACGKERHAKRDVSTIPGLRAWLRTSCRDPLPTCGARCGRPLNCGFHNCTRTCHDADTPCGLVAPTPARGPTPPPSVGCNEMVKRQCRCAAANIVEVSCVSIRGDSWLGVPPPPQSQVPVFCDVKCRTKLACKKHTCNQLCCPRGVAHVCTRVCGKPMECGRHTCDSFCHLGQCGKCAVTFRDGLQCACGRTSTAPNVKCGTPIPPCPYPCRRPRECGHACVQTCHENPCAPCVTLVNKTCAGGHSQLKSIPCFATPSCGITCKKPLSCGIHLCVKPCHAGRCTVALGSQVDPARKGWSINPSNAPASSSSSSSAAPVVDEEPDDGVVRTCKQKCGQPRPDCGHACQAQCHPGEVCPTTSACRENVRVYCACRRLSKVVSCTAAERGDAVPCVAQCEVETRNARFRDALQLDTTRATTIPYPGELLDQVIELDLFDFAIRAERILSDFIAATATQTQTLPPMSQNHRWLIHQLATYCNVTSESFDAEPRRAVRLVRTPTSVPLKMKITDAIKLYRAKSAGAAGATAAASAKALSQSALVHLWDLDAEPRIAPADLLTALRSYSLDHSGAVNNNFRVNWLDRSHAMVVFHDTTIAAGVRASLERRNLFNTTPDDMASDAAIEAFRGAYRDNSLFRRHHETAATNKPKKPASSAFDDWTESRSALNTAPASESPSSPYTSDSMTEAQFQAFLASTTKDPSSTPYRAPSSSPTAPAATPISAAASSSSPTLMPSTSGVGTVMLSQPQVVSTNNQWSSLGDDEEEEADAVDAPAAGASSTAAVDQDEDDWQMLAEQPTTRRNRQEDEEDHPAPARDAFDD